MTIFGIIKSTAGDFRKTLSHVLFGHAWDDSDAIEDVSFNKDQQHQQNTSAFWERMKRYIFLRFDVEVPKTLSSRAATFLPGLGEVLLYGIERLVALPIEAVCHFFRFDHEPFFHTRGKPVYISSLLKSLVLLPVLAFHAVWRFTVSMPAYMVSKSNAGARWAFCIGLAIVVVAIICFTAGAGMGPGALLALLKLEMIKTGAEVAGLWVGSYVGSAGAAVASVVSYALVIKAWSMIATCVASLFSLVGGGMCHLSGDGKPAVPAQNGENHNKINGSPKKVHENDKSKDENIQVVAPLPGTADGKRGLVQSVNNFGVVKQSECSYVRAELLSKLANNPGNNLSAVSAQNEENHNKIDETQDYFKLEGEAAELLKAFDEADEVTGIEKHWFKAISDKSLRRR